MSQHVLVLKSKAKMEVGSMKEAKAVLSCRCDACERSEDLAGKCITVDGHACVVFCVKQWVCRECKRQRFMAPG